MATNMIGMFESHPENAAVNREQLAAAVATIVDCSAVCTACADACLAEDGVAEMRRCIRTNLDCADVCSASARVLLRQTAADAAIIQAQLNACAEVCQVCADECARHAAKMEHCRVCADTCRRCVEACHQIQALYGATGYA